MLCIVTIIANSLYQLAFVFIEQQQNVHQTVTEQIPQGACKKFFVLVYVLTVSRYTTPI